MEEQLIISPRRAHMYYDTINGIDQTACGYLLLNARRGEGEVNCGRCLRVLAATERFFNKHGWDCKFQLIDGRIRVVKEDSHARR
jgi:hypothetical protein